MLTRAVPSWARTERRVLAVGEKEESEQKGCWNGMRQEVLVLDRVTEKDGEGEGRERERLVAYEA